MKEHLKWHEKLTRDSDKIIHETDSIWIESSMMKLKKDDQSS